MEPQIVLKTTGWQQRAKRRILEQLAKATRAARFGRYGRARRHLQHADETVELFNPFV